FVSFMGSEPHGRVCAGFHVRLSGHPAGGVRVVVQKRRAGLGLEADSFNHSCKRQIPCSARDDNDYRRQRSSIIFRRQWIGVTTLDVSGGKWGELAVG